MGLSKNSSEATGPIITQRAPVRAKKIFPDAPRVLAVSLIHHQVAFRMWSFRCCHGNITTSSLMTHVLINVNQFWSSSMWICYCSIPIKGNLEYLEQALPCWHCCLSLPHGQWNKDVTIVVLSFCVCLLGSLHLSAIVKRHLFLHIFPKNIHANIHYHAFLRTSTVLFVCLFRQFHRW